MTQRTFTYVRQVGTNAELSDLRQIVENRGDTVVSAYWDDPAITGKGKYAGWHRMMTCLDDADVVLIPSISSLPSEPLNSLYKTLAVFERHGVRLCIHDEEIDTGTSGGVLDLIAIYRRAQTSLRIKRGQERARNLGKRIGRPTVPGSVRKRILADLLGGLGVRATGRRHNVSAASVINIKRSMEANRERQAA